MIVVVGVSHRTAPVAVREQLAVTADELEATDRDLADRFGAAVVLSTCNRTEIYVHCQRSDDGPGAIAHHFVARKGFQLAGGEHPMFALVEGEAVRHLLRVACGVDSMILGEAQILGQVREAFTVATEVQAIDPVISRLFHAAITTGRRARAQTSIGRYAVSISTAAVDLLRKELGGLEGRSVLIVSAGQAGKLAARALRATGARLTIVSRTMDRAEALAGSVGGVVVPWEELPAALTAADGAVCATGAADPPLTAPLVRAALAGRGGRRLVLVDIAVPRDVEVGVHRLPGVRLFDIDDLNRVSEANVQLREREVARVEAIVEREAARYAGWLHAREVVPTIAALRQRAEAIRRAELEQTLARISGLSEEDRQRIEALTTAIVKKMLHLPIVRLKDQERGRQLVSSVHTLFDLPPVEGA